MKKIFSLLFVIYIMASTVSIAFATELDHDNTNTEATGASKNSGQGEMDENNDTYAGTDNTLEYITFQRGLLLKPGTTNSDGSIKWEFETTDEEPPATRIFTAKKDDEGNWELIYMTSNDIEINVYLAPSKEAATDNLDNVILVRSKTGLYETSNKYEYDKEKGLLVAVKKVGATQEDGLNDIFVPVEFLVTEEKATEAQPPEQSPNNESDATDETPGPAPLQSPLPNNEPLDKERFINDLYASIPWDELSKSSNNPKSIRIELNEKKNGNIEIIGVEVIDTGFGATLGVLLMFATAALLIVLNIVIFLRRK